ncbi:MAG TPA: histidine phosphatase family protein [Chloroflexia bacterium]|nr:histidine phosphatase family protein [Chloroflexia bacterium]
MNLYLVRHGLSTGNVAGRLQGWSDTDLTPEGLRQAYKTAQFFAYYRATHRLAFAAVYSSPLRRAWLTAAAIGERLGQAPLAVLDLREMHAGAIEGLTLAEWQSRYPEVASAWRDRENLDFGWPGGETRRGFRARCLRAISEIVAQHAPDDNLIVVTHGGFIKGYLAAAGLIDTAGSNPYSADNCSITYVQFTVDDADNGGGEVWGVGCLRVFNQVAHLQDGADDALGAASLAANADLMLQ